MLLRLLTKRPFTKAVDVDSKYAKQSGGRGQYGHCKVQFEPMDAERRRDYSSSNLQLLVVLFRRNTSRQSAKVSKKHAKAGILGGFPVVGVHANVYDGSYHEVDSSEMAFHIAGSMAFKDAMKKGSSGTA